MDHGGFSSCVASTAAGIKMRAAKQPSEFTDYSSDFVRNRFLPEVPEAGCKSVRFCFFHPVNAEKNIIIC